ncbi:MAG: hypothetical protein ACK5JP_01930 [Akkermansiaceae bacterium]
MAIQLIANYSKRLGLPGYSSHQFSVSVETELVATDNIAQESERLYQLMLGICFFIQGGEYTGEPVWEGEKGVAGSVQPRLCQWIIRTNLQRGGS